MQDLIRTPALLGRSSPSSRCCCINVLKDPGYLASLDQPDQRQPRRQRDRHPPRVGPDPDDRDRACALVIATGGIDLSVGSMMAVGGRRRDGVPQQRRATPDSVGAALAAIGLAARIVALCSARSTASSSPYVGLQPFISTLVMMLAGRGIAKVITGGQNTTAVERAVPVDRQRLRPRPAGRLPARRSASSLIVALRRAAHARSV